MSDRHMPFSGDNGRHTATTSDINRWRIRHRELARISTGGPERRPISAASQRFLTFCAVWHSSVCAQLRFASLTLQDPMMPVIQ